MIRKVSGNPEQTEFIWMMDCDYKGMIPDNGKDFNIKNGLNFGRKVSVWWVLQVNFKFYVNIKL